MNSVYQLRWKAQTFNHVLDCFVLPVDPQPGYIRGTTVQDQDLTIIERLSHVAQCNTMRQGISGVFRGYFGDRLDCTPKLRHGN